MKRIRPTSRALFAGLGLALLAGTLGLPVAQAAPAAPERPAAPAAPAALQASGPFAALANASLLTVDVPALSPPVLPQTNVVLANSVAGAQSNGDLDADKADSQRTAATAGTTGSNAAFTNLLDQAVQLDSAAASALPPQNDIDDPEPLIPIGGAPLLDLGLLDAYAEANWISDTECVSATTPLSLAEQELASATVLTLPDGGAAVTTGPDAVSSLGRTGLVSIPGANDPRAVQALATARVTGADVLDGVIPGLDSLISVDVAVERDADDNEVPQVIATASGLPGGATVEFADNVVTVSIGGTVVAVLNALNPVETETVIGFTLDDLLGGRLSDILGGTPLDPLVDPLAPILNPLEDALLQALEALQPVIELSIPRTSDVAADGTSATGSTALLQVRVLPPDVTGATEPLADALTEVLGALGLDITQPLADVQLGPVSATAIAPLGGINCGDLSNPLELQKVHSGPAIPGSTFDYTIAVGNISDNLGQPCTMSPVSVTDIVTGPPGTTIVSTEPAGATVTPVDGGFRIEWADVGPIEPGGRTTLRIRVGVPDDAQAGQRYNDVVSTRVLCDGRELTDTKTLPEPEVETRPSGPCNIEGSTKAKSHINVYPGESFVYFVNVYNSGGAPCTNTTVTDALDARLTFESCSDGCTVEGRNVTWNLGTVNPGQSLTLRVQVKVNLDATGTLANAAQIDTDETPPFTVNVSGPNITTFSELSPGDPARTPDRALARTGGTSTLPVVAAAALALAAFGRHQLRRRTAG